MFRKDEGRAAIAGLVQRSNFEFGSNRAAAVKDAFWRANHVFATFWANAMRFVQVERVSQ